MYLVSGRRQQLGWLQSEIGSCVASQLSFWKHSTGQQATHISDWACSCLFEQNLEDWGCSGLTTDRGGQQGAGWAAQTGARFRKKKDISLELVTAGRGWAPFQLAWRLYQGMCETGGLGGAMHWAAPFARKAQGQRDVIHLFVLWRGILTL